MNTPAATTTGIHWRQLLIVGASALLLGLLLQFPAPLAWQWFKPKEAPGFDLAGVQGTLLHGGAGSINLNNRPALTDIDWKLRPWWLLLGNLSARLHAQAEQTVLEADVSAWPGGRVKASDLNYSGSLQALLVAIGQPYLPLDGMVRIADARVSLKKGWPRSAAGSIEVQGLAYTLAASPIVFGDFVVQLEDAGDDIGATINSVSGPLELKGTATLKADQSYQLDIGYRPKPEATPVLRNLLASNGAPDADGWYHLRQQKAAPAPAP